MDKFSELKEHLPAAMATWQQTNGGKTTVGWLHVANPEVISALLAELEAKDKLIITVTEEREFWRERVEGAEKEREEFRRRFNLERSYTEDADQRIAELEFIRSSCGQVFNEIGSELGCNPDNESIMVAIDDLKATQMTGPLKDVLKRNIELEAKLATPVRLPDSDIDSALIMAHWCSGEEVNAWVKGINYAKQQIRTAGFKCEGDEQ